MTIETIHTLNALLSGVQWLGECESTLGVFQGSRLRVDMSNDRIDAESKVSGNQANIPARIRRELEIDDGDQLRWQLEDDGSVRVQVVQQSTGTFAEFDGYEGDEATDVGAEHDAWGVDDQ